MGNFPVQYTEAAPSGRISGIPARETGAMGRAISGVGRAVGQIGQKIQDAEDAMELSTLQRKSDEIWNAAYDTMRTTEDPERRAELFDKAKRDASAMTSKSGRVNDAYQMHLNSMFPRWEYNFNNLDRELRIQRATDEYKYNAQAMLENGDVPGYAKLQYTAQDVGVITPETAKYNIANADKFATIAQARVQAYTDPHGAALQKLADPNFRKTLTGDELAQANNISNIAKQKSREQQMTLEQNLWNLYRTGKYDELMAEVDKSNLPVREKKWWLGLTQPETTTLKTDATEYDKLWTEVHNLNYSSSYEEKNKVKKDIASSKKLSITDKKSLLNGIYRIKEDEEAEQLKNGRSYLRAAITGATGNFVIDLLQSHDSASQEPYINALRKLDIYYQKNKANPPSDPQWVYNYAVRLGNDIAKERKNQSSTNSSQNEKGTPTPAEKIRKLLGL